MVQTQPKRGSTNHGCLAIVLLPIMVGVALIATGYFVGTDVTAYNTSTGGHESINTTLYWIGGVFASLGIAGSLVLFLGRNSDG